MMYAEIPVIHLNHVLEAKKYFQDDKNDNEQSLDYPSLVSFENTWIQMSAKSLLADPPATVPESRAIPLFFSGTLHK